MKDTPELAKLWELTRSIHQKNFECTFAHLNPAEWAAGHQPLIQRLLEAVRERQRLSVRKAFTSIALTTLAKLLGMTSENCQSSMRIFSCTYAWFDYLFAFIYFLV